VLVFEIFEKKEISVFQNKELLIQQVFYTMKVLVFWWLKCKF